jgi:hypothetical protein
VTGVRQHIEQRESAKDKTMSLFADDLVIGKYRFSTLASDMDLAPNGTAACDPSLG